MQVGIVVGLLGEVLVFDAIDELFGESLAVDDEVGNVQNQQAVGDAEAHESSAVQVAVGEVSCPDLATKTVPKIKLIERDAHLSFELVAFGLQIELFTVRLNAFGLAEKDVEFLFAEGDFGWALTGSDLLRGSGEFTRDAVLFGGWKVEARDRDRCGGGVLGNSGERGFAGAEIDAKHHTDQHEDKGDRAVEKTAATLSLGSIRHKHLFAGVTEAEDFVASIVADEDGTVGCLDAINWPAEDD